MLLLYLAGEKAHLDGNSCRWIIQDGCISGTIHSPGAILLSACVDGQVP
jgi:hypothetical protein